MRLCSLYSLDFSSFLLIRLAHSNFLIHVAELQIAINCFVNSSHAYIMLFSFSLVLHIGQFPNPYPSIACQYHFKLSFAKRFGYLYEFARDQVRFFFCHIHFLFSLSHCLFAANRRLSNRISLRCLAASLREVVFRQFPILQQCYVLHRVFRTRLVGAAQPFRATFESSLLSPLFTLCSLWCHPRFTLYVNEIHLSIVYGKIIHVFSNV